MVCSSGWQSVAIFNWAISSPRVLPGLMIASGLPSSFARRQNRKPEKTCSELPIASTPSALATALLQASTLSRGTDPPKNTTSGLRVPPHSLQAGTRNWLSRSGSSSASPSGFIIAIASADALSKFNCLWISSRQYIASQSRQRTLSNLPCRSITLLLPAL